MSTGLGRGREQKTLPNLEILKRQISDLWGQLDRVAQIIIAKDNIIERLDQDKEKLENSLRKCRQRIWRLGLEIWRDKLEHRETDAEGEGSLYHKSD